MGIFGDIINSAKEARDEAKTSADNMSLKRAFEELNNTSSLIKTDGYAKSISSRCHEMSDSELKYYFEYAYLRKNIKACKVMMYEMEERELAHYDDDDNIVLDYYTII